MILIHINLCFYPTNWYVLIHINSGNKKEIESWRYLLPSWLLHCLSPSSHCACHPLVLRHQSPWPSPSPRPSPAAVALCAAAVLPPPPQPLRCCHRAAAVALCATAALPMLLCHRKAAATAAAAAAAPLFVSWLLRCCPPSDFVIACHHVTLNTLIAGVTIFVQTGMY
jgi:hypothetical protein